MKQFAIWEVGEEEYKLKLKTSAVCSLEEKLNMSLMDVIGTVRTMPSLSIMLTITHAAMKDWNAGIKRSDVDNIFDKYIEGGGSQLEFFTKVFMDIYKVSGFFSQTAAQKMEEQQEKAQEMLE
ncbi:MAG: DUF6096 family protein [Clostridium sp.]|uniref:DUF6096 family protein n=1 Tax=Clostridium culturomicium TaxID=1499683 RepID=UPI000591783D|nr:DUF6096 family protein [Clostridium culturomicium]MDU4889773.1 DUF6096 family protein [Clostridium sp.]MDU7083479.1 DUF6096 family protein [Clostridium sp.]